MALVPQGAEGKRRATWVPGASSIVSGAARLAGEREGCVRCAVSGVLSGMGGLCLMSWYRKGAEQWLGGVPSCSDAGAVVT